MIPGAPGALFFRFWAGVFKRSFLIREIALLDHFLVQGAQVFIWTTGWLSGWPAKGLMKDLSLDPHVPKAFLQKYITNPRRQILRLQLKVFIEQKPQVALGNLRMLISFFEENP